MWYFGEFSWDHRNTEAPVHELGSKVEMERGWRPVVMLHLALQASSDSEHDRSFLLRRVIVRLNVALRSLFP